MFYLKKLAIYIAMFSFLGSILPGCSKANNESIDSLSTMVTVDTTRENEKDETDEIIPSSSNENETNSESSRLESWLGQYTFSEFIPPDQNMYYSISINQENGKYYAQINIDGFQTMQRLKAKVLGDENDIQLIFEDYLPDNVLEPYDKGDILLSLKKENEGLYTFWNKIEPMLDSNKQSDQGFFLDDLDNASESSNYEELLTEYMLGELVGIWHASPIVGAGYSERFFFYDDGTFKFCYSQYDEEKRILDMSGNWTVKGERLILSVLEETVLVGGELAEPSPSATSQYSIVNATVEKRHYDEPKTIEYTFGKLEEDKEGTDGLIYGIKLLINGQYYWRISLDPYNEGYNE